jgi:uncharacterized protein with WD repeat
VPQQAGDSNLRLLVLADSTASFYTIQKDTSSGNTTKQTAANLSDASSAQSFLQVDSSLPVYSQARLARFAPYKGHQAAIVTNIGLHLVNLVEKKEALLLVQLDLVALEYSPRDNYVICCEKWNMQKPAENLFVIDTKKGRIVAKFEWKKSPKESMKSIRFSQDETYCIRLVPCNNSKDGNSIEIYKNGDFNAPFSVIQAKFQTQGAKNAKKGLAPIVVDGRFDGFDLCCLNPAVPIEKSPFYMFAWQHAATMETEDDCGNVYAYDL